MALDLEQISKRFTEELNKITPEMCLEWCDDAVIRLYGSVYNIPDEDLIYLPSDDNIDTQIQPKYLK